MNQEVINLTKDYRNSIFAISLTKGRQEIDFTQWGAGEYKIAYDIKETYGNNVVIYIPYLTFATLEKAMVFTKFCEKQKVHVQQTIVGYLSYGRQERETEKEPKLLDLLFSNVYNELYTPTIIEPHNLESVEYIFDEFYWTVPMYQKECQNSLIVSPDKGAEQRLETFGITPQIKVHKHRTLTNEVSSEIWYDRIKLVNERRGEEPEEYKGTFVIYDDICDGGRTFANVAELVKERYPNAKIELYIAHAILPYGVESLKGKIDKIVALDTCFPVGVYFDGFLEIRSAIDMFF